MAEPAIITTGLTKHYGDVEALVDLDLTVERGEVFGFLGPNGAGKTTTIRLLLDYIAPTAGSATVLGLDARHDSVALRSHLGYIPGEYSMYDKLTGGELLEYFANLRGGADAAHVRRLAERFDADLSRKISDYSTGNKQKIGIIQAFMNRPELLILDEPSTGLDPLMQQELQTLIREVQDDGATVFLSSHTLSEVERVADRVGILRHGHLVVVERVNELKRKAIRRMDIEFESEIDPGVFERLDGVRSVTARGHHASVSFDGPVRELLQVIVDHDVMNINSREADLEEIFLAYYRNGSLNGEPVEAEGEVERLAQ